ncbi:MAG TPA: HAD family hydrolase [Victivallales bacterium]|nr:HAD family hydrolase [Victivallales bacterium]
MNLDKIKVIAFDADDTLWENEIFFFQIRDSFVEIMSKYADKTILERELGNTEIRNLSLFGYGAKGFTISMIETAIRVSDSRITNKDIVGIIDIGKFLMSFPIQLYEDVEKVLHSLKDKYKLILATKGDLIDQERKLSKSGLAENFHHIEIMSNKNEKNYSKLLNHLDVAPEEFLMIGNSLKSDILPVVNIGCNAIHIPCEEATWAHEYVDESSMKHLNYYKVKKIVDVLSYIK